MRADLSRHELLDLVRHIMKSGGSDADVQLFIANCKHPAKSDLIYWPHGFPNDSLKPDPTVEQIVDRAMTGRD